MLFWGFSSCSDGVLTVCSGTPKPDGDYGRRDRVKAGKMP